jgi:uncharacterized protein (DUF849 family)
MLTLPEDKVIINMAATGAMSAKTMNPAVPEQPEEIARSVYGASDGRDARLLHSR